MIKKILEKFKKKDKPSGGPPIECLVCNKPAVTKCKEEGCDKAFCEDCAKQFLDQYGLCINHSIQIRDECMKCRKVFFLSRLEECSECQEFFCQDCLKEDPSLLRECSAPGCDKMVCSCVEGDQECSKCRKIFCSSCSPAFLDPRTCDVCDDEGSDQPIYCSECAAKDPGLLRKCANPLCHKHICHRHLEKNKCKFCLKSFCNACGKEHLIRCTNHDEAICRDCTPKQKNNVT